jgi:uncharacterized protein (TIGR00369 family)
LTAPSRPEPRDRPHDGNLGLVDLLGIRFLDVAPGRVRIELTVEPRHLRDLGIMHGGVLATLLDTVMGTAVSAQAPSGHFVVTVQLNVNFIRPAWQGETLVATGEVTHSGRQTAVARGEVRTSQDVLVGSGSGTFMYIVHTDSGQQRFAREVDEPGVPVGPGLA